MQKLTVSGQTPYEILIENGLINSVGEYVRAVSSAKKVLIISDTNVFPLYGNTVKSSRYDKSPLRR